ncbi:MAG: phage major capsid protein, partial [Synergistaceae bacterium]|nr:phage major capsid protein [Synergistaceae bacterium]
MKGLSKKGFDIQFFAEEDSGIAAQVKEIAEGIGAAFEEYRKTNDARIEELKKGGQAGELETKLAKIEADVQTLEKARSALEAKLNRPGLVGGGDDNPDRAAYRKAFEGFVRKGNDAGLAELQIKAVQVGVDGDGGYAVPEELSRTIYELEGPGSPMRQVCTVLQIGTEEFRQLVDLGGAASGWVGETAARPDTNTPQLGEVSPVFGEIYAQPKATQKSLDDIFFNVESWLAASVAKEFAMQENTAFTIGNGTNKPKGLLAYPAALTADGARAFGTLQYFRTGVAAGFPATSPSDLLIDVIHGIKPGYRAGAVWMLNGLTLAQVRKWKDSDGNYLWQPGLTLGVPSAILGYGYVEN